MKIGIISMQEVINYGSFLQSYALMKLLDEENVSHISLYYNENKGSKKGKIDIIKHIKETLLGGKKYIDLKMSYKKLKESIIPFQNLYFKYDKNDYDLIVVGSDEVFNFSQEAPWNNKIFFGGDIKYKRLCSFAASCGSTSLSDFTQEQIEEYTNNFKKYYSLSVRDQGTLNLLNGFKRNDIQINLDPVLLYDFKNEIANNDYRIDEEYIVVYSYNNRFSNENEINEIKKIAKEEQLKIIAVEGYQSWADEYLAINPFQLFNVFKNAKYIFTDTFHGTIIAAKLHKNFAVFIRESNKNKLGDLIERLCIKEHLYKENELKNILEKSDFSEFEMIVSKNQKLAKEYIEKIKDGL